MLQPLERERVFLRYLFPMMRAVKNWISTQETKKESGWINSEEHIPQVQLVDYRFLTMEEIDTVMRK
jgi:hypothetical protein